MSERHYFSLRYAIPGYTLILLVVATNYVPLFRALEIASVGTFFGAFLAFLSLLTGSALGFLVAQIWWWYFKSKKQNIFGIEELRSTLDVFVDAYHLPKEMGKCRLQTGAVLDYVFNLYKPTELRIAERKWDMYHLLSTTMLTLTIGWPFGILFRLYSEAFLFHLSFSIYGNEGFWPELLAQAFVLMSVAILYFAMHRARHLLMVEYKPLFKALIRRKPRDKSKEEEKPKDRAEEEEKELQKELKTAFSEYFESESQKSERTNK